MISIWAFWIPVVQTMLLHYSAYLGVNIGPLINGFVSCHSILILSAYATAEALDSDHSFTVLQSITRHGIASVLILLAYVLLQTNLRPLVNGILSNVPNLTPVPLQMGVAAGYSLLLPSKMLLAIPAIAHTLYANPHFRTSLTRDLLEAQNWTLVDRQWSNTGYISVLDSSELQYRLMRADHSLLGGEWLLTTDRKEREGWLVPEPVYAVFSMLESVRLLRLSPEIPDSQAQALVIGLGIGTAPKAFIAHGINTTVVELDPIVHSFATQYFDLPTNHTAVLKDAVPWVAAAAAGHHRYDFMIHDVFTGGAEPLSLFTTSFLHNLRSLLTPNGAIALNYASDLSLPLTKLVLNTINQVFSSQCKIYRDSPPRDKIPPKLQFPRRLPQHGDFLPQHSRSHLLPQTNTSGLPRQQKSRALHATQARTRDTIPASNFPSLERRRRTELGGSASRKCKETLAYHAQSPPG